MRKDYEAEIANLKSENRELKTRASEEKKEREKFQELVKAKKGEILSLRGELEVGKEQSSTKRAADIAVVKAAEMLVVKETPGEFEKKETARGGKERDVNKCPLCKTCKQGDWQLCTVKKCGQWVHCRCEAQLDTSYSCPFCRGHIK
ncbi:unnamed protein product [Porites evermanni]|uniref:RING-type domain-containing protein n=1 Tax=Porites evermanni TaxID=104178 RepID=A0ABN8MDK5_9CNID|nr:unnamed protein product [Porites evermanni]